MSLSPIVVGIGAGVGTMVLLAVVWMVYSAVHAVTGSELFSFLCAFLPFIVAIGVGSALSVWRMVEP